MCIINRNIFQPRILHKPELNETLPKTNLKKNRDMILSCITYCSYQLLIAAERVILTVDFVLAAKENGGAGGVPLPRSQKARPQGGLFGQKKCPSAEGLGIKKSNPPSNFIKECRNFELCKRWVCQPSINGHYHVIIESTQSHFH